MAPLSTIEAWTNDFKGRYSQSVYANFQIQLQVELSFRVSFSLDTLWPPRWNIHHQVANCRYNVTIFNRRPNWQFYLCKVHQQVILSISLLSEVWPSVKFQIRYTTLVPRDRLSAHYVVDFLYPMQYFRINCCYWCTNIKLGDRVTFSEQ